MSNPEALLKRLHDFRHNIVAGEVPVRNINKVSKILMNHALNPDTVKKRSCAASFICKWLISTIAYFRQVAPEVQPPQVNEASPPVQSPPETCAYFGKGDIVELKSLAKPPQAVMIVCVCAGILLGRDADAGWAGAKKQLADAQFLKKALELKKSDLTVEQIERVREMLTNEDESLGGDKVQARSKAAYGLLKWVRAMIELE